MEMEQEPTISFSCGKCGEEWDDTYNYDSKYNYKDGHECPICGSDDISGEDL